MIKVVMFDLDGTLLPMDQREFIKAYFGGLAKKLEPYGYKGDAIFYALKTCVEHMANNNGQATNEEVFWKGFCEILGEEIKTYQDVFVDYYKNEFQNVKNVCGFTEKAKQVIELVKKNGMRLVLATSPMFPKIATESRIRWAGLKPEDFEIYTTYEDYSFAKPNLNYYEEVLKKLDANPSECLMIGNDTLEDMVAENLGINVFLLTDNLINKQGLDVSKFKNGNFDELMEYIKNIK